MATSKVYTECRQLWHQEDQEDPEQVAADEAAAAKRLELSRYDYRELQAEGLEKNELALQVP